jgi:hypothetical protein
LPANIKPVWKRMAVNNALAYYDTATIAIIKSFVVQAPELKVTRIYFEYAK